MAASRMNYIITWTGHSQVYGCASKEGALETPPPHESYTLEDKRVFFITYQPDNKVISVHEVPREEVLTAEIKVPKPRKKKDDEQDPPTEL